MWRDVLTAHPAMSQNETTSNGWDLIAAASQNALNTQLAKIPPVCVQADVPFKLLGNTNVAHVDITIHQPELRVKDGSGRQVDVLLLMHGVQRYPEHHESDHPQRRKAHCDDTAHSDREQIGTTQGPKANQL